MKIGIILTDSPSEEIAGEEMVAINKLRPWLKHTPREYIHVVKKKPQVTYDVSVAMYIRTHYPKHDVDMISPDETTVARLHKNDLNFLIIFDQVDSWHSKTTHARKSFVKAISEATNVFPDARYQELISYKHLYYDYLRKHGIPIADFMHFSRETYHRLGMQKVIDKLRKYAKAHRWTDFIGKPELGQGSADFKFFPKEVEDHRLAGYLEKIFKVGYPGVIFQKFVEGFADKTPEFRQFYVGKNYLYTMITDEQHDDERQPKSEGGTFPDNKQFHDARHLAEKVLRILPAQFSRTKLPRLLTRIDVGCCVNDKMFCSEVEYVPSLFINSTSLKVDAELAEQAVLITAEFVKAKTP